MDSFVVRMDTLLTIISKDKFLSRKRLANLLKIEKKDLRAYLIYATGCGPMLVLGWTVLEFISWGAVFFPQSV